MLATRAQPWPGWVPARTTVMQVAAMTRDAGVQGGSSRIHGHGRTESGAVRHLRACPGRLQPGCAPRTGQLDHGVQRGVPALPPPSKSWWTGSLGRIPHDGGFLVMASVVVAHAMVD